MWVLSSRTVTGPDFPSMTRMFPRVNATHRGQAPVYRPMPAWLGIAGIVRLGPWLTARMLAPGSRPRRGPPARSGPGQRLGLPEHGPDSIARFGRRLCGIIIDWVIALVIARGLFQVPLPFSEETATEAARTSSSSPSSP